MVKALRVHFSPREWSAWLPIAIALFLLVLVLRYLATHGAAGGR